MALGIDAARAIEGALLVDKPAGPTSHDIVAFVRRTLKISRVGHTGTLDPLATGLLVVLVGQATRMAQFLAADEKEYLADVRLGVSTPTYDAQSLADARGERREARDVESGEIAEALDRFRGTFLQAPPAFSAKKINSVPAYQKARKNEVVELRAVEVTVRDLEWLAIPDAPHASPLAPRERDATLVRLRVAASAGFYVRSLAHDLGQALGCGAHLEALRRTRVGRFRVEEALTLDQVEARGASALIPLNELLGGMPAVTLTADGERRASHGNPIGPGHTQPGDNRQSSQELAVVPVFVRLLDASGTLLAVAERRAEGLLHPLVVLG